MTHTRRLLVSFGAALALWLVFSWPLPRYLSTGIPVSSQNVEKDHVRRMIPGDHLQLLYHFQLMRGMLSGRTPWLHNIYEFNTGNDAERYQPGAYYAPFSLVYAPLAWAGGRAFGWNAVGFLALWMTYWLTWLLVRRYVRSEAAAAMFGLIGILIPYRWVNLLGGSPTGLAMMLVPAVWLGLDVAVRDERPSGGVLAGASLLFLCWCDLQTFFFCGLAAPFWLLLALIQRWPAPWRERGLYRRWLKALLPIAGFMALAVAYRILKHQHLSGAGVAGGRSVMEVMHFSPTRRAFFRWAAEGLESHVYIGFTIPLMLGIGGLALLARCWRRKPGELRRLATLVALGLALILVAALALGMNGPFDGKLLLTVRRLIPPFAMLRQTAKVFCLLPSFLAVACAMAVSEGWWSLPGRRAAVLSASMLALAIAEMRFQVRPTICLLDNEQGAYAAVAKDAEAAGTVPRALVLPIWPGDESSVSVYEYYAEIYGIRMINGYSPVVSTNYIQNTYERLRCANQGWLPDSLLDELLKRGIRCVLLHENLFPEKVSPFPVMTTLERLVEHPRLDFLAQAETVRAFRIRPAPRMESAARAGPGCPARFAARRWEIEDSRQAGCRRAADGEAGNGACLILADSTAWVETRPMRVSPADDLRWMIRARGDGVLQAGTHVEGKAADPWPVSVTTDSWTWYSVPVDDLTAYAPVYLKLACSQGAVAVDMALFTAGEWRDLAPGERLELPAACFFHGGFSQADLSRVMLRAATDHAAILYGPKLPFAPGRYAAELCFTSSAAAATELGQFYVEGQAERKWIPAKAGQGTARIEWVQTNNLPVNLVFVYLRNADMAIDGIRVERLTSPSPSAARPHTAGSSRPRPH